ncbi:FecR family protein [Flagellimonas halotolerans]|uniref:FecR domain-containing protein n=1 Tax=Flagellimonas halotolerans TaxID=3112164 RepID=A0ABU6IP45_9FLAO|nr:MULTISPECIES: FecR domain-containing protein [unclassified Allomuricauda]MEC3965272.1 FecR domain-containing protein [Muricauda sp. SYSU M86414]MEC4264883.1 FecR domain-containing protein [Muricauda sp. SYSU M84420]
MEVARLIYKKLTSKLGPNENLEFNQWLSASEENEFVFQSIRNYYKKGGDISKLNQLDADSAWNNIREKFTSTKRNRVIHIVKSTYKYAAILIIALIAGYFYWGGNNDLNEITEVPITDKDGVVIVLDSGEEIALSPTGKQELVDKAGNKFGEKEGHQLSYLGENPKDELIYNTLWVSNGERFDVVLSDSTHIYLNSGSSLRYPVTFLPGKKRQVFLEGEAFFEVSKDKKHPFVVTSANMDVEVLGTKFNVYAYPEEDSINTVLVEGSVRLNPNPSEIKKGDSLILQPGHIAYWDKKMVAASTKKVDTDIYTSWMDGKLVFKGMRFRDIIKRLERHYNVSISNQNDNLNERLFTATFDVETIDEVLSTFASETKFEYEIKENQITISKQPQKTIKPMK